MEFSQKYLPQEINLNLSDTLLQPNQARFIKNIVYDIGDTSDATKGKGSKTGVLKTMQANRLYLDNLVLPAGYNHPIGYIESKDTREVFVFVYNELRNDTIYRLNGDDETYNIVYQGDLGFVLDPTYFIHQGGGVAYITYITDPVTKEKKRRTFLKFTTSGTYQRSIVVEDSIATSSFNATLFPYFQGNYDPEILINMGVPTPTDCISIEEVPLTDTSIVQDNKLLFNTWQFRLRYYDVWGRMSEYGIISDMYIPANNCLSTSSLLPRCLNLTFDAPPPHINQVEIAYRNCNGQQWYTADVLDLYNGSNFGEWWLRERNDKVTYIPATNKIVYQFCADKDCAPIAPADTNRFQNALSMRSNSLSVIDGQIAVGGNRYGFMPFSQDLLNDIQVTVEAPNEVPSAIQPFGNAIVWVEIFNPNLNKNQPIYRQAEVALQQYGFGAYGTSFQSRSDFAYKQYFKLSGQKGFGGYLAGTSNLVISKQYSLSNLGVLEEVTNFDNLDPQKKYFQKFEFLNIPRGKYLFRLAAHQADLTQPGYQKTSTYTAGTYSSNYSNPADPVNHSVLVSSAKELEIDICSSDYDTMKDNKTLVVYDLNLGFYSVNAGYVYNTNDNTQAQYGIELLEVTTSSAAVINSKFTDHNGFYFTAGGNNYLFAIDGNCNCAKKRFGMDSGGTSDVLFVVDFYMNTLNNYGRDLNQCIDFNTGLCNKVLVKGKVVLCNSNIPVPNVSVVLSRGSTAITDSNGEFTIIAHDDMLSQPRVDKIYYMTNSCGFKGCDDLCIEPKQISFSRCVLCTEREVLVDTASVSYESLKGLLDGATYPVYITGMELMGRGTFLQAPWNITIPSVQTTKVFAPSRVKVTIPTSVIFPADITNIIFSIGTPAGISDYIEWIVDDVEFIDNTGKENTIAPTQIKIYYGSLIEYNKQNEYNTTVNWSFISDQTNEPVLSDQVQFIINGDGTFFDKSITSLVKYNKDGQYFLINYTDDLKNLKQNAKIRIIRPKDCTNIEPGFEVCSSIPVVNGKPTITEFYLNAYDTYYLYRQIPVPVQVGDETVNELRIIGIPFESRSPSDFWGEGCKNIGRQNVYNPQEAIVYRDNEIALSGSLSPTGQLNYLDYFEDTDSKKKQFPNVNGIVSILPETAVILVLGQNNWFLVGYNDTIARVNASGQVTAPSTRNAFGEAETKVGNSYGCLMKDKMTIDKYEGIVQFLDTIRGDVLQHNYSSAVSISANNSDGYIRSKIKNLEYYNQTHEDRRYFHGCISPINGEYLLTDFLLRSESYINPLKNFDVSVSETLSYNIYSKAFKATYGFTPQMYAKLESDVNDSQLFSFKDAIPYKHYSTIQNQGYGSFYGVVVERVLRIVANSDFLKKKKPLSVGVYCKQGAYFCPEIVTETGQKSRILLPYFTEAQFGFYAPFLCDLNTPPDPNLPDQTGANKLLDGNLLVGNYITITFVGDPAQNESYTELEGVVINVMPSEYSGAKQ